MAPAPQESPRRTARITLMALGTFQSYGLREGGPVDMMIVSPEDDPDGVLRRARRDQPGAKVFGYLNTMDLMLSRQPEPASFWKEREDWFLHGNDGKRVTVRIKNYRDDLARYAMNVAHPAYQEYLADRAVALLTRGYDGLQLDNVETDYSYRPLQVGRFMSALPAEMSETKWYAGEQAMLRTIRQAATIAGYVDRDIIFNHMRAGEPERATQYLQAVEGANAEDWMSRKVQARGEWGWKSRIDLARNAALAGKRTNVICIAASLGSEEALFAFASYLMAFVSEKNTFWYGRPYRPDDMPWYPFYDVELGQPTNNPYAVAGSEVYRRDFQRGTVLVNPNDGAVTVPLGEAYMDDAFEMTQAAIVPGKGGAILMTPDDVWRPRVVVEGEGCVGQGSAATERAPAAFRRLDAPGRSGRAAVQLNDTKAICSIPATVRPGKYRVVVDGEAAGSGADAVGVNVGGDFRRIAFEQSRRQIFDVSVAAPVESIEIRGAESGVIVDRVVLVRVGPPEDGAEREKRK
ncbi:MAG: hypothetical protein HY049_10715 [Acidobacteria bacterium]|nr:hypothetical protein [Acidobacteriota bacterium]